MSVNAWVVAVILSALILFLMGLICSLGICLELILDERADSTTR
jgi:hypothetical protein